MFDDTLSASLAIGSAVCVLAAGEQLFDQGATATAIYEVESGRLRLLRRTVDDHLVILHTARRGELLAEAALFSDTYHCDGVAAVSSRVRVYPKAEMIKALRANPAFAEALIARLAHQIQELRTRMELRNIRSARERVLQYLRLRTSADQRSVPVEGKLQDIAAELGMSREAFYRALAGLEAEGRVARTEAAILLKKSSDV